MPSVRRTRLLPFFVALTVAAVQPGPAAAAVLQPRTAAAFERYAASTESRISIEVTDESRALWLDSLPVPRRRTVLDSLKRGELVIDRLQTRDSGREIEIPGGLVHHWIGVVFVPGVGVDEAVALLQNYDRHATIYAPAVQGSKILARDGDTFRVYLRFFMKKVITVVLNSEHDARFTRVSPTFAYSRIVSTRIAEVESPGTADEREKPVGNDGGYLWRLNTYWRFLERDGGVYVQCESTSLTRRIPPGLGWLVGPFVTSIPRESLAFTLETTRKVLAQR